MKKVDTMDPAALGNDLPPPQRSRLVDFRFTDPVRFLFEHMQGDNNKPNSSKVNNDEWVKDRSAGKGSQSLEKNVLSPTLKGSFQDLYAGDNVFNRMSPASDKQNSQETTNAQSGAHTDATDTAERVSNRLPPVQSPANERTSNRISEEISRQPSGKPANEEQKSSGNATSKSNNLASLVYATSKLEAVANNLSRHRISSNATPGKRQERPERQERSERQERQEHSATSKPPVLKPPPLTKRLASRAFRRPGKPPPPFLSSAPGRTPPPQSTPLQASATGNKPPPLLSNPPAEKQPTPPATVAASAAGAAGAMGTAGAGVGSTAEGDSASSIPPAEQPPIDPEQADQLQQLVQLCKKSDWQGVETMLKQFSKSGLPPDLTDEVRIVLI